MASLRMSVLAVMGLLNIRLKSSLEEALASNREQASDFAKVQDELRKTRSSLQVCNDFNQM